MIGTVLDGRYRILRKLGEGGMGEVYLAEHIALGRKEALKILHPTLATEPQFVSRFRREARAMNRVQHANIVGVYDFGKLPDGRFYLTMEHVDGERLDAILRRVGTLPIGRATHILAQLAEAIDHAHSRGVIHRDLKPENMVLVEHRGRADVLKVLDFGIAKIIAPEYTESIGLTRQGEVFGTACYMSPEQFHGEGRDPRIDLYALGCIAFELVVGETPFVGRTMELMHAHLTRAPDRPGERRPEANIPAAFDELVLRCLEKDPVRRFQTGRDVLAALEKVPGFRTQKSSSGRRTRHGLPAAPDFDSPDTEDRGTRWDYTTEQDSGPLPPGAGLEPDELRPAHRAALRALAETLIDLGHGDFQLIVGVASFQELEDDLIRSEAEAADIEARTADREQAARERESALRFALGELRFVRTQAGGATRDLDRQIAELEKRLARIAAELESELNALTERAIALAASRATIDEKLAALSTSIDRLVSEAVARFGGSDVLAAPLERYRAARDSLRAAEQRAAGTP